MGIDIVFRIAGIGILVAVACQLLKQTGRDDIAMLTALAGLVFDDGYRSYCNAFRKCSKCV